MHKLLDQILVIDLESTCWEGSAAAGDDERDHRDRTVRGRCGAGWSGLDKRCLLVRPVKSQISPFCTQLTTLTDADFQSAGTLADAAQRAQEGIPRARAAVGELGRLRPHPASAMLPGAGRRLSFRRPASQCQDAVRRGPRPDPRKSVSTRPMPNSARRWRARTTGASMTPGTSRAFSAACSRQFALSETAIPAKITPVAAEYPGNLPGPTLQQT